MGRLIVFADADGTLVDERTYSPDAARPGVEALRRIGAPLIVCSSKTIPEIERLQAALGLADPFIAEGGAVVVAPDADPRWPLTGASTRGGKRVLVAGPGHDQIRRVLHEVSRAEGVAVRGFADMEDEEIGRRTGLPPLEIPLARAREGSEPFVVLEADPAGAERLRRALEGVGLRCQKGNRFWHAMGPWDKGEAARLLLANFAAAAACTPYSVGIGDSPNDLPMLQVVDRPYLVRPCPREAIAGTDRIRITRETGPAGFSEAIAETIAFLSGGGPEDSGEKNRAKKET